MNIHQDTNENKLTHPRYVQITEKSALILLKILEIESDGVTIPKLSDALGFSASEFIKEAEGDSRQFLAFNDWSSTKGERQKSSGGRHTDILEMRPDKIVTNPLSAQILLFLAEKSKKSREVNREEFTKFLIGKFSSHLAGKNEDLTQEIYERINFLSKIGDICYDESVPSVIWIDWIRFHSQRPYLKLLANKLPKPLQ